MVATTSRVDFLGGKKVASNSTPEGSVQRLSFEGRSTEWKTTGGSAVKERFFRVEDVLKNTNHQKKKTKM